ncbi:carboxymethylenebutenolidase [Sphingomonas ginkgonis]|uniref:Carboxymethylenebutenolidase n=1 Tax=Sphingomonas ginkgonis TaxID=2315330 RepID=A0A429V7P1_9SPHN|nr:dienelactone hydrolase family protein [Sphingomonas ginkgonis]RST29963.1 carboxymethylenebutenolidase [Sphingomonas ginkgonis]
MTDYKPIPTEFEGESLESAWLPVPGVQSAPSVLIFPTVMGVTDLELGFGAKLNAKGYSALVGDLFGKKFHGAPRDTMFGELNRLKGDRAALRRRVIHLFETMQAQDGSESQRTAAIGFCFGGLCALDLARSGTQLDGVASFHGLFDPPGLPPEKIKPKVIAFHGWDDPMVKPDAVEALARELTDAGADWQIHAYGHVGHGFTNPNASSEIGIPGVQYNELAAKRSWANLELFLGELFGE